MGRFRHYTKKFRMTLQTDGLLTTLQNVYEFMIRRWFGIQFLAEAFEYHVLAKGRSIPGTLIKKIEIKPLHEPRALIYVSYDRNSLMQEHVVCQLQFFFEQKYDIIFVTTSPAIVEAEMTKIRPFCAQILHRQNIGYDFASYALGFEALRSKVKTLESLVVMNDSCTGPHFDFTPLLNQMISSADVVYGLTKSLEIVEHIQSYFYHFGAGLNASGITESFFSRIRILNSKWGIVRYLEIGSSVFMSRQGVSLRALIDPAQPDTRILMKEHSLTEPTREPLATRWIEERRLPFKKRSADLSSEAYAQKR